MKQHVYWFAVLLHGQCFTSPVTRDSISQQKPLLQAPAHRHAPMLLMIHRSTEECLKHSSFSMRKCVSHTLPLHSQVCCTLCSQFAFRVLSLLSAFQLVTELGLPQKEMHVKASDETTWRHRTFFLARYSLLNTPLCARKLLNNIGQLC
jgi:hypothetical protein